MEGCGGDGGGGDKGKGKKRAERDQEEEVGINRVIESNPSPDDDLPPLYLPAGYHFHPTDDELILYYLLPKLQNKKLPCNHIKDIILADYNPEVLTEKYKCIEKSEWYFFTPRERKYKNGSRPNRAAGCGYWKATGVDIPIISNGETVGFKKSLVFYTGKSPNGIKSNWIMNEFRIKEGVFEGTARERDMSSMRLDDWVLCRIYKKPNSKNVSEESLICSSSTAHKKGSPSASGGDHENESLIACQSDHENKSPIAYQRDRENEDLIACQGDNGGEKMKMVMEESSHANNMITPQISSYWYGDEQMNMVMEESSYGNKMVTPEITSSKKVFKDHENVSPIAVQRDYENEYLIAFQGDYGAEKMKMVMEESSHANTMITPQISSYWYGDEKMNMVMQESSYGNKMVTPEITSSKKVFKDHENVSPIAFQRDYENEYLIACQGDYGVEKMKMVMEESSHGNKMITPQISSFWYGDEKMNMVVEESSYGNKMVTPEITSSKTVSKDQYSISSSTRDYEKESPKPCHRDHGNEPLIACQRDHKNKSPIPYQRDQFQNESLIACNRDYRDERMKIMMEESSPGNKTITPGISLGVFNGYGDEKMKTVVGEFPNDNKLITPETRSEIFDWNDIPQMPTNDSHYRFGLCNELISNSNAYNPFIVDCPQLQLQPQVQPQPQLPSSVPNIHSNSTLDPCNLSVGDEVDDMALLEILKHLFGGLGHPGPE